MQIVTSTPELARAVHTIIATGMAAHLIHQAVNLRDDKAVLGALKSAGFGGDSVKAQRLCAAAIASRFHVISNMVH